MSDYIRKEQAIDVLKEYGADFTVNVFSALLKADDIPIFAGKAVGHPHSVVFSSAVFIVAKQLIIGPVVFQPVPVLIKGAAGIIHVVNLGIFVFYAAVAHTYAVLPVILRKCAVHMRLLT